ncbi:MAG TPA: aldo/keto reductase [Solirubrobacterales bacterium]|jgi:2,5-diketo-D-gluconate reductase A
MSELTIPSIALHDGVEIPQLGLGVFQAPPEEAQSVVEYALDVGYRHIDIAASRRCEAAVGAALAVCDLPREEVFVTTKLWNAEQGYDSTLKAFEATLGRIGLEYVDLCLVHWPVLSENRFLDTWRASERILEERRARTIGVSNCQIEDLERLEVETDTRPTVHQIGLHSRLPQVELRRLHAEYRIATEIWSPLAHDDLLADEAIGEIAARHGRSSAQAILRWQVQIGNIAIPKSVTAEGIRESIEIFDFELSDEEMATIGKTVASDGASGDRTAG